MFVSDTSVPSGAQDFPVPETAAWRFAPLTPRSYDVLVIDPPWHFKTWSPAGQTNKSASGQYRTMPDAEILALPVRELLKPDAIVYLWATGAMLPHALETMQAWGITYKTSFVWRKVTRNGKVRWGTGRWAQSGHEHVLLGVVGKPHCFLSPSIFDGLAREHSRKPAEFYNVITEKTPGLRRADVFAREQREGWDCWGDEVEKFSSAPSVIDHNATLASERQETQAATA